VSDPNGPTVRRRRLGSELRRLREKAGLDQAAAAERLECSTSKISRMEKGQGLAKRIELQSLLDLYEVTDEGDRAKLLDIHRRAAEVGWWEQAEYVEALPSGLGIYVGLEFDARQVQCWEPSYVPGLLQTEAYARTILADGTSDPDSLDRLVDVRMQRQRRMTAESSPLELWAIIDETVLLRPVGGTEVMREQIAALVAASQRPNVTIQVYPLTKGAHPGMRGAFSLLEFGPSDPRVGYVDSPAGNSFLERDRQVRSLAKTFRHLTAGALDPVESTALMRTLAAKE
jgi:transcriptional regulator with XRE-family HTH domain